MDEETHMTVTLVNAAQNNRQENAVHPNRAGYPGSGPRVSGNDEYIHSVRHLQRWNRAQSTTGPSVWPAGLRLEERRQADETMFDDPGFISEINDTDSQDDSNERVRHEVTMDLTAFPSMCVDRRKSPADMDHPNTVFATGRKGGFTPKKRNGIMIMNGPEIQVEGPPRAFTHSFNNIQKT